MRLLVITQKVDSKDANLGFFHVWLSKLAEKSEHVYVICLEKGPCDLPKNVTVLSLGKEDRVSRRVYIKRFYTYIFKCRHSYKGVFVHMNPEYVILGGLLWRLMGYPVVLWYLHKAVTLRLWLAEKFVTHVFTASPESCRLQSKKIIFLGHGINTDDFKERRRILPINTVALVSVGRIAPTKDLKTLIFAVYYFKKQNPSLKISLDIYGDPITQYDFKYADAVHALIGELGLEQEVRMQGSVVHSNIPKILMNYNLFVHASRTGSVDKAVLEALAAGLPVATSSDAYMKELSANVVFQFSQGDSRSLAQLIEKIYGSGILESAHPISEKARVYIKNTYNLDQLIDSILTIMSNKI